MRLLRLGLAQMNPTVGDLCGNIERISSYFEQARTLGVDLLALPELAITGYPPEDLLFKPRLIDENLRRLREVAQATAGLTAVVGFVDFDGDLYNAAAVLHDGRVAGVYHKMYLPNYGVFDEDRYFRAGTHCPLFRLGDITFGVSVCEDIWHSQGPPALMAAGGAELIININASPFHFGKRAFRERMLSTRAYDNIVILAYVNSVGGQDELVFDGNSMVFNEKGELMAAGLPFAEELLVLDVDMDAVLSTRLHDPRRRKVPVGGDATSPCALAAELAFRAPALKPPLPPRPDRIYDPLDEVYRALVVGTRDYVRKNGFNKVLIGLSGGIDSSLVAVVAVDALGKENVVGVAMPSRFSSEATKADTEALVHNLGVELLTLSIEDVFPAYLRTLTPAFGERAPDVTEENIQARIRGNFLMALSNKFGWLVLTTGNKSEMATGYTTLYGDMAGGFAVIKDVPKTLVYRLAASYNVRAGRQIIPDSILAKPPTAELRLEQRDVDTLPPYEFLDPILQAYVEDDRSADEITAMGFDRGVVERVIKMVDLNEYKRRQAPPGVKITPRAFGRDRRLPITNRYRDV